MAFEAVMNSLELSKKFPVEERYSLTNPIRRSSRADLVAAWIKRRLK